MIGRPSEETPPAGIEATPMFEKIVLVVIAVLAFAPSAYKMAVLDYAPFELWRHLMLDVTVVLALLIVMAWNPIEKRSVYTVAFIAFFGAYLYNHFPKDGWEWFGTLVVFSFLWSVVFPMLHTVTPYYVLGLLLAYVLVLRIYLPGLNRDEVAAVLAKGRPEEVARSFYMETGNHQRPMVAAETLRYYVRSGDGYADGLRKAVALTQRMRERLDELGISYLNLRDARTRSEPLDDGRVRVTLPEQDVPGFLSESDPSGARVPTKARISGMSAVLVLVDGKPYVAGFDDAVRVDKAAAP
jgi:hypothetical protein